MLKTTLTRSLTALFITGIVSSGPALAAGAPPTSDKHEWMSEGGERLEALELEGNLEDGLDVYEVCSACHLPEGWGTEDGTFPQIAGQLKNVIIKQLDRYSSKATATTQPCTPLPCRNRIGDAQALADVAAYMEKLPMNPDNGKGENGPRARPNLIRARQLYEDNCVKCHGDIGQGELEKVLPAPGRPALSLHVAPVRVDSRRQAPQCQSRR